MGIDELLRTAIEQKRLIRLSYKEKSRIIEPHDYGVHKGRSSFGASSERLPNWRWIEVNSISDIQLLNRTFPGGRPSPLKKHHQWDQLFLRVKPPEDEEE